MVHEALSRNGSVFQARGTRQPALPRRIVLLFAMACGLSVANIYFAHPLLDAMARDLAIRPAIIGIIVTATQIGYGMGLIFIVPLGDLLDRRRLIVGQIVLSAMALVVVGLAPSSFVLLAGMVVVGLLAVVVQVLVAFAATLANADERGRIVGGVTSGVVIGILLSRFVAGVVADIGGWRSVYLGSAGLMLVMAILLIKVLPGRAQDIGRESYLQLLRSMVTLFYTPTCLAFRSSGDSGIHTCDG